MTSLAAIAGSGLQAALGRLDTVAHNVANASTPGFARQTAHTQAQTDGGVSVRISPAAQQAAARDEGGLRAEDAVELLSARHAFAANLKVLRTADEVSQTLLDVRA